MPLLPFHAFLRDLPPQASLRKGYEVGHSGRLDELTAWLATHPLQTARNMAFIGACQARHEAGMETLGFVHLVVGNLGGRKGVFGQVIDRR